MPISKSKARTTVSRTLSEHAAKWNNCQLCELCNHRINMVLMRGQLPCDILFIGEAPGESEDILGKPFVGPAGILLDEMVSDSVWASKNAGFITDESQPAIAFGNLLACVPRDETGSKIHSGPELKPEWFEQCLPRVVDMVKMSGASYVIAVGKTAKEILNWDKCDVDVAKSIEHPASILRSNIAAYGVKVQKVVVSIVEVIQNWSKNAKS